MKHGYVSLLLGVWLLLPGCAKERQAADPPSSPVATAAVAAGGGAVPAARSFTVRRPVLTGADIVLTKELLYDQYTLPDVYRYQETERSFKWPIVRKCLAFIENMQDIHPHWGVFQNYKNLNGEAPLVEPYRRNEYRLATDTFGIERYQSVPLYAPTDTLRPFRYGRDGAIAKVGGETGGFYTLQPVTIDGIWRVPKRYVKLLPDSVLLRHVIFVDRKDQNICTLEWAARGEWKIRSMNPATTGRYAPPYARRTPLGLYLLQQKKTKMVFLKDGSNATGGFAPYASRFTNGAHIHGVPTNVPATRIQEYSWSLGTVPRSHQCVRNATSHAKFIFDWAPLDASLVVVIE